VLAQQAGAIRQMAVSALVERWLRIQTTGRVNSIGAESVHYTPLPYMLIFRMLQVLALGPEDVFVDIGCGKGRVLCCASRHSLKGVVGIELNEVLLRIAERNLKRLRGRVTPVNLLHVSAEQYAYDEATVIYLYNPFNRAITEKVIDQIYASHQRSPRRLRVVYANPVHEQVFTKHGWLRKFAEWSASDYQRFGYPVSFWETSNNNAKADL
jgi:hypothetical protein